MSKKTLLEGPIHAAFIAESIAKHQSRTDIGAHAIFLGQVRADGKEGKKVKGIEYMAYDAMAEKQFGEIRESAFARFDVICLHIYHSVGYVASGEIGFFVFVSSRHRDVAYEASRFIVEEVKAKVPVFGKEWLDGDMYEWKANN